MKKIAIGIDFGATWIKAGVVDQKGKVIYKIQEPTKAFLGKKAVISRIELVILTLLQKIKKAQILGIGIGAPGPVDTEKGLIKNPPNLPGWKNVPFQKKLTKKFKLPVFLENDANIALLGEQWRGAAKDKQNVILVAAGTGIGGAAIISGEIYHGASGGACEFGHIIIDKNFSEKCGCGNYGCLEALSSAKAIDTRIKEALKKGQKSLIPDSGKIDSLQVYQAAQKNDKLEINVLDQAGKNLGIGIIGLINIFDPELVIISGQLAKARKYFWQSMQKQVAKNHFHKKVSVIKDKLGDNAGILGAASLVFKS